MPRPARVIVIDHTAQMGGAEIALVRLLRNIDKARFDPHVVLLSEGPLRDALRDAGVGVSVMDIGSDVLSRPKEDVLGRSSLLADVRGAASVARAVYGMLRTLQPDLIHTTSLKSDILGLLPGRLLRTPIVWYVHDRIAEGYLPPASVHLVRWLAAWGPDRVIANSEATRSTLLRPYQVSVAYPGVDATEYPPRRSPPLANESALVGMLGRVSPTKGQDVFIRAARLVLQRHPTARFEIAGDALFSERDYARWVERLPGELGIADRVRFRGWATDPAAALQAYDLLVHASPVPEPFGQVVVEAMLVGTPVVASDGGGVPEIVRPRGGRPLALLSTPGDPVALASAVADVLTDRPAALERAADAQVAAHERFDIRQTAQQVMAVWTDVLLGARGRN